MGDSSDPQQQRPLPNSLRSNHQRPSNSKFDFSWIGGIANRIRNVLHQRTDEEMRSIERQSEAALQERVHSFVGDQSHAVDDTLNLEPSQQLERDLNRAPQSLPASLRPDIPEESDSETSQVPDLQPENENENEMDMEEELEIDEDLDEVDEDDEVDYEMEVGDFYQQHYPRPPLSPSESLNYDTNADEEMPLSYSQFAPNQTFAQMFADETNQPDQTIQPAEPEPVHVPEHELESESEHKYEHEPEHEPEHESEHEPEHGSEHESESEHSEDAEDLDHPEPEYSDHLEHSEFLEDSGHSEHEVTEQFELGAEESFGEAPVDEEVEHVEPSDHEAQEYNPELSSMSLWEENGFDSYDQRETLHSEANSPQHDESHNAATVVEDTSNSVESKFDPVERFVGFSFGPQTANSDEKQEEEKEVPVDEPIVSRPSSDSAAVPSEPQSTLNETSHSHLLFEDSRDWNLFNVGFSVAPSETHTPRPEQTPPLRVEARQSAEADFDEEFSLLAQTAHHLISSSSIFGGAPRIEKRKREQENSGETAEQNSALVDPEKENERVSSVAHALFADSPLFGGAPKKRKTEEAEQEATKLASNPSGTDTEAHPEETEPETGDQASQAEEKTTKRPRSSRKTAKAAAPRQIPERTRPMTRSMLRKLEKEKEQEAQESVDEATEPKSSGSAAEKPARTKIRRSRKS